MASNMNLKRECAHCKRIFIAKKVNSKCCSQVCAAKAYKVRKRAERQAILLPMIDHEYMTIKEVAKLLRVSIHTAYKMIDERKIKAVKFSERITRVKRSELNKLFERGKPEPNLIDLSKCYKLGEVRQKYNISSKALYDLVNRNKIQKIRSGWHSFVPKDKIDAIFKTP